MLLPIIFYALPYQVWNPIAKLSFLRSCAQQFWEWMIFLLMENNIIIITCKLQQIFSPGFFNYMKHMPIHLPYEVRVGGPIQYRWMYSSER